MTYDHGRNKVVLFGGSTYGVPLSLNRETWEWNGSDWTLITTAHSPSARAFGAIAYDPSLGNVLLFGGEDATSWKNDTWKYDGVDWTQLSPTHTPATSPSSDVRLSMCFDEHNNYVVAWQSLVGSSGFGETWIWNGSDWILTSTATVPPHRFSLLTYDSTRQLVVMAPGNLDGNTFIYADTWLWDGTNWTNDTSPTPFPVAFFGQISGASWEYSSSCAGVILFGADDISGNPNKTWKYSASGWANLNPPSPPIQRQSIPSNTSKDPSTGNMMMFGGLESNNTTTHNDTWLFSCTAGTVPSLLITEQIALT